MSPSDHIHDPATNAGLLPATRADSLPLQATGMPECSWWIGSWAQQRRHRTRRPRRPPATRLRCCHGTHSHFRKNRSRLQHMQNNKATPGAGCNTCRIIKQQLLQQTTVQANAPPDPSATLVALGANCSSLALSVPPPRLVANFNFAHSSRNGMLPPLPCCHLAANSFCGPPLSATIATQLLDWICSV